MTSMNIIGIRAENFSQNLRKNVPKGIVIAPSVEVSACQEKRRCLWSETWRKLRTFRLITAVIDFR